VLKFLSIQNIVLIDKTEIDFSHGLCVLSGETGSGKSILLDALGLAIGFRSNLRLIGSSENKAYVNAQFDINSNQACKNILQENDLLDLENPNTLNIRRVIQENSNNKVYINDILIGVNLLNQIGETLVEIHGQHDQRGLMNSSFHGQILDEFAQNQNLLKDLKKIYDELKEADKKIFEIKSKKEQATRERDYLDYIIKELSNANIEIGEEEDLSNKKDQFQAKEKILTFLSELKSNLIQADSHLALSQKILIRNQNLIDNYLPEEKADFEKLSEKIDQENIEIESSISTINSCERSLINSEESLEEIEERLFYIRSLARKFSTTCDKLPQIISDAEEKLGLLKNEESFSHQLEEIRSQLLKDYNKIATNLSEKRKKAALLLSTKVEEELKFLKMEGTKFLVDVKAIDARNEILKQVQDDNLFSNNHTELVSESEPNYTPNGFDKIRFLASINKNSFDDISKIASGGELSRFMLALKVALMNVKSSPTIIFDEIDTGIGGSTADAVGKRLKALSKNLQILVVTHQPQIAAKADVHFKISKISNDSKIRTLIEKLDNKNRELEIARMLSGEEITPEALAAANRLIY
jgi:DNA repair protein RecN (Recombination protein N)